ncbi:MAG: hypothetical protein KC917_18615 [Candidatus Omnitrophica bacterium]|nr:hypothetical protein [Candidatus Omnitrophota bacterium]MCA9432255.1 hypothetical protein [Candidatus Omnitrophota bacterium]MCA9441704.1 hypothetical protein [Candidatus Omnitrophota bacterium]MCB9767635.1 hypothetical protein [Candidatus Omnitrophota bacterium]MCB9784438.1 hypothetical protein [Candidatus Omnitrophota bacterium]
MFKTNQSVRWLGCVAAIGGLLWCAGQVQAAPGKSGGERSYYFSRTATPYSSYEEWLKANPRQNHPYHEQVHGPLFHQTDKTDPANTEPIYNQPAFWAEKRIKPPYGTNRILWVNDRYYSGKYYPTAKKDAEKKQ